MSAASKLTIFLGLFLLSIWNTGCTLNDVSGTGTGTAGKQDIQAAGRILGESLSSDESGIILSLNDALTSVSENGFIGQNYKAPSADRSGRGSETHYRHTYRQQKGIHTVSFRRQVQDALFSKTVTDSMNYRYRGSNGINIKFPRQNQTSISSVYFDGRREGQISTLQKQSDFVRRDTFIINGINTPELSVDGVHHSQGSIQLKSQQRASYQRSYTLEINLLNITAPESAFNNSRNFWKNVSGTLSWQLNLENQPNGTSAGKKMGGTIKLAGSGIALLNFRSSARKLQVNLDNGDLKDQDEEFEGRVETVNIAEQSISLLNGRTLYLTSETKIENEDFTSLEAVDNAINGGIRVWAEGEGSVQDNRFIVTDIELEREENDVDDDNDEDEKKEIEFEERVSSVDAEAGIFILANEVSVLVNSSSDIDHDGDYQTLQAVADALENGTGVKAEGEAVQNGEGASTDLTALNVEFKKMEDGDNDNGSGEED